ncbi:MAG: hypothetical protein CMI53_04710 [Parcubacteria group bacterium]|jgi:DNA-binding protein YbaB|nr:hypothetical protein [Parcubacteria group bacterium]|tara:strand:- start:1180 stop:1434 length:255 start_codon:yes stop_codon:yes gene_type:complete
MLDKFKELGKLKALQDQAKNERFEANKDGVKVVVNGSFNVEEVVLNSELTVEQQADIVKECFNDAIRNAQMGMAQKMQGLGLGM